MRFFYRLNLANKNESGSLDVFFSIRFFSKIHEKSSFRQFKPVTRVFYGCYLVWFSAEMDPIVYQF